MIGIKQNDIMENKENKMIDKDVYKLRQAAEKIAKNSKLRNRLKRQLGVQDALAGYPAKELVGPYYKAYIKTRKTMDNN